MNKIDSNVAGLSIAEETTLKVLPGASEVDAVWQELEPNSFSDFGGTFKNVQRAPINASRQNKKGKITDLDATGGFNIDFTQNNLTKPLQGFFFADAREKADTQSLNAAKIALTTVTSPANEVSAAAGLGVFKPNHLVLASGFGLAANNGLAKVSAAIATKVTLTKTMAAEAVAPATARLQAVGYEFPVGDVGLVVTGATEIKMTSTLANLNTLGLTVGEWIFIGGDLAGSCFATGGTGFARIASILAGAITFDETTFTPATDTGATKTIRIFFGLVIRNEKDVALIKRRSYNLERQLGSDDDGIQSEYLLGSIPNEITIKIPKADKINCDLSFTAMDYVVRTGAEGIKAGTRLAAAGEDAFNTSSDVYRLKMSIFDTAALNQAALFGFVSDGSISIKNNVTPDKAVSVLGAFDATAGNFTVGGNINAYFSTVEAVAAIRNNSDIALNVILCQNNAGSVFDIPALTLGNGKLSVQKDQPITVPLDTPANENANGYTALYNTFAYLPDIAMPD